MITYLKGKVVEIGDLHLILDVNNVGFFVNTSNVANENFKIGDDVTLLTELVIRENSWQVYGFLNNTERELFHLVTKVQGVGSKVALSILSALKYDVLGEVIKSKNHTALCAADGIGEKLASRIVNELHKKIPENLVLNATGANENNDTGQTNDVQTDVASALLNFGFKQYEIKKAMNDIDSDGGQDFESLLKITLNKLKS